LVNMKLWQAARATSAAPAYFKPLQVNGYTLVDGGLGANNPLGWYVKVSSDPLRLIS
jgi:patatin-like phospholipase/acyl hydrolase